MAIAPHKLNTHHRLTKLVGYAMVASWVGVSSMVLSVVIT